MSFIESGHSGIVMDKIRRGLTTSHIGFVYEDISNQHLSRMELADIPPTEYHEHLLSLGMERLLAEWDDAPEELKQEYQTYKGRLLQPAKEVEDEH